MDTFESKIVHINSNAKSIFEKLSNLENLRPILANIPQDKIKAEDIHLTADTCSFNVENMGEVGVKIMEREEYKCIKFASDKSPVEFNIWIQLVEKAPYDTKAKITFKADLPFMIKMFIKDKLANGLDQVADLLTKIQY
ncbi:MAG: SRPBCC family protein [Paludibacteraceae bacterium]|nr:SRPBCC family protein [Paludibacteraceae bacterium]MBR6686587.1 SRPBCC family protein [Paludibacteraceae bacterium]